MECTLYEKKADTVQCKACSHRCIIAKGKTGICGVRENKNGKLVSLLYGKVSAMQVDSIEKKPLFHFLPGTYTFSISGVGCNFKCAFCQNYHLSQTRKFDHLHEVTPEQIVEKAQRSGCESISYTYNEPTIFIEFVHDVAKLAQEKGLKNILVTNGYMTKECLEYIAPFVDAMNIDLKAYTNTFYHKICSAKLQPVLDTIKRAHEKGIHVEITTLVIPDENDKDFEKIAQFIASVDKNIPWHISRFFPMYKMLDKTATPIDVLKKAEKTGKKYLKYVYIGNV
jgi:pyruvate formate lyase activating enzyme